MPIENNERTGSSEDNIRNQDLKDSRKDRERLKPDETTIDLPDAKDIPGQEHIHVPRMGEMADTTISSADEEGEGLFIDDEEDETTINMGTQNDIPRDEKVAFETSEEVQNTDDDNDVRRTALDNEDFEREELNESFDRSGKDLDIPGSEEDDVNEEIGEEDEENNSYSIDTETDQGQ
jgi:hypothetical protein